MESEFKIAIYRPRQEVEIREIEKSFDDMMGIVGGQISLQDLGEGLVVIYNAGSNGLPNRYTEQVNFKGTFFVCRCHFADLLSIRPDDENKLRQWRPDSMWNTASGGVEAKDYGLAKAAYDAYFKYGRYVYNTLLAPEFWELPTTVQDVWKELAEAVAREVDKRRAGGTSDEGSTGPTSPPASTPIIA